MPDLLAAIYPSMAPTSVAAGAPPPFGATAGDDELFVKQGCGLPGSWRRTGRPVELHVFERRGTASASAANPVPPVPAGTRRCLPGSLHTAG